MGKEAEAEALTGKDNKKARAEISKQASSMKQDPKYVDAVKVLKGLPAPNGNFMTKTEAAPPTVQDKKAEATSAKEDAKDDEKKQDKPKKKMESAGLSPDEKKELDKLKTDIIQRKSELKAAGKSGGECNKDEQVVAWVARMTELKIKEDPSLAEADAKKAADKKKEKVNKSAEKMELEKKIEEYRLQLISEFQYSKKDINADPDMMEMQKQLAKMK